MHYTISEDRKTLTIHADAAERQELADIETCGGHIACDVSMHDFLEPITCNSELEWLLEGATGDLTCAPMLGIYGAFAGPLIFRIEEFDDIRRESNKIKLITFEEEK